MPFNTELTQQMLDITNSIKIVEMNMIASGSNSIIADELEKEKLDIINKLITLLNKTMNSQDKKLPYSVDVKVKNKKKQEVQMLCD